MVQMSFSCKSMANLLDYLYIGRKDIDPLTTSIATHLLILLIIRSLFLNGDTQENKHLKSDNYFKVKYNKTNMIY